MLTLSYSFQKPQTGDKGSVFFPALESDLQKLNDHTHNGTNSARLTAKSVTAVTGAVPVISWSAQGGGMFRQTVTMPAGMNYDDFAITFRDATSGLTYLLQHIRVTATTYFVYSNDNTIDVTAVYS